MALTKADKAKIIEKFGKNLKDTGNSSVQIALLTERINYLSQHIAANPKDFSSKRTLSILISKRKSLLNYIKKHNIHEYTKITQEMGLRK
ncbi:MAG: 30S ribosomal protein S15 [Elusimicrobiales bacterium]|nr:30S ribosomal protein S15 [Elusimicrobiales bacterium]